jgi:hypothetical protein
MARMTVAILAPFISVAANALIAALVLGALRLVLQRRLPPRAMAAAR